MSDFARCIGKFDLRGLVPPCEQCQRRIAELPKADHYEYVVPMATQGKIGRTWTCINRVDK